MTKVLHNDREGGLELGGSGWEGELRIHTKGTVAAKRRSRREDLPGETPLLMLMVVVYLRRAAAAAAVIRLADTGAPPAILLRPHTHILRKHHERPQRIAPSTIPSLRA